MSKNLSFVKWLSEGYFWFRLAFLQKKEIQLKKCKKGTVSMTFFLWFCFNTYIDDDDDDDDDDGDDDDDDYYDNNDDDDDDGNQINYFKSGLMMIYVFMDDDDVDDDVNIYG